MNRGVTGSGQEDLLDSVFSSRMHTRRGFLNALTRVGICTALPGGLLAYADAGTTKPLSSEPAQFRVWVFSDAHVGRDLKYGNGRESLADAIRQSESADGFDWDIALNLGDISGEVGLPKDAEGEDIVHQFGALKKHRREQIYDLSGNHDRSGLDEPQAWWFRKWIDPTGEHSVS